LDSSRHAVLEALVSHDFDELARAYKRLEWAVERMPTA
jgi:hypothetical protein